MGFIWRKLVMSYNSSIHEILIKIFTMKRLKHWEVLLIKVLILQNIPVEKIFCKELRLFHTNSGFKEKLICTTRELEF